MDRFIIHFSVEIMCNGSLTKQSIFEHVMTGRWTIKILIQKLFIFIQSIESLSTIEKVAQKAYWPSWMTYSKFQSSSERVHISKALKVLKRSLNPQYSNTPIHNVSSCFNRFGDYRRKDLILFHHLINQSLSSGHFLFSSTWIIQHDIHLYLLKGHPRIPLGMKLMKCKPIHYEKIYDEHSNNIIKLYKLMRPIYSSPIYSWRKQIDE